MKTSKNEMPSKQIRIVRCFDCIDLRKITSQSTFLKGVLKQYRMQHLDAVLYTNQALTRFRMVLNLHNTAFLCTPEIDEVSRTSLYLRISEVLAMLSGVSHVTVAVSNIEKRLHERAERQAESSDVKDSSSKKATLRQQATPMAQ